MKKIIVLLVLIFSCTACYDYNELNDLSLVSGIAIDYDEQNDKFITTFEILNDEKSSDNGSSQSKSFYVKGSGKTIAESFNNSALEIPKTPYYAHLKVLVISEKIAKNNSNDIIDYILRYPTISNIFYLAISKEINAQDILRYKTEEDKIVSDEIYNLIDKNELGTNISMKVKFEDFISKLKNKYEDPYVSTISIKDDNLKLDGLAIWKNNKMTDILNDKNSQTLTILLGENKNASYRIKCNDEKYVVINIYNQKIKTDITAKKAKIIINAEARIIENGCNLNLKDSNTYKKLSDKFSKSMNKNGYELIDILQNKNSDPLSIAYSYYKKTKKNLDYKNLKFDINSKININKNGLIFEVTNDNK